MEADDEDHADLLVVKDSFAIIGRGLVVVPDFSVPDASIPLSHTALVKTPDGRSFEADLHLVSTRFRIADLSVPVDARFRIMPTFPHLTKADLPVGSRILVDAGTAYILKGTSRRSGH